MLYRERARAGASRVCWLKRRILGALGVRRRSEALMSEKEDDGLGEAWTSDANHLLATSMLSRVCPPSRCHVMLFSRRVSHRPPHLTCSKPRMNSAGRGSVVISV